MTRVADCQGRCARRLGFPYAALAACPGLQVTRLDVAYLAARLPRSGRDVQWPDGIDPPPVRPRHLLM
eukprot:7966501-Pyramimonas_sp.AAC.1